VLAGACLLLLLCYPLHHLLLLVLAAGYHLLLHLHPYRPNLLLPIRQHHWRCAVDLKRPALHWQVQQAYRHPQRQQQRQLL
jgi:hypothetical protein